MTTPRTDWTREEIAGLFDLPFTELLFQAASVHRKNHPPEQVQLCTLLSIKTGGCPEDCGYCSQSVHADSASRRASCWSAGGAPVRREAKDHAAAVDGRRLRNPKDRDMPAIVEIVKGVRDRLETCRRSAAAPGGECSRAGLDSTNTTRHAHPNLRAVITTRRGRRSIRCHRRAGHHVQRGIVGMGRDRAKRGLRPHVATLTRIRSVPSRAGAVKGTVWATCMPHTRRQVDDIEFVRTVAAARITIAGMVRSPPGAKMSEETRRYAFSPARLVFTGDKLLTAPTPATTATPTWSASWG